MKVAARSDARALVYCYVCTCLLMARPLMLLLPEPFSRCGCVAVRNG